jgi:hypothetical protein
MGGVLYPKIFWNTIKPFFHIRHCHMEISEKSEG